MTLHHQIGIQFSLGVHGDNEVGFSSAQFEKKFVFHDFSERPETSRDHEMVIFLCAVLWAGFYSVPIAHAWSVVPGSVRPPSPCEAEYAHFLRFPFAITSVVSFVQNHISWYLEKVGLLSA